MDKNMSNSDASDEQLDLRCFDVPTDVVLVVEGRKLYVNKGILSSVSPVFDKMFHGDFKEKSLDEIPLPGKKCKQFLAFLSCIYPGMMEKVSDENVEMVLPLAAEYQVEELLKRCDDFCVKKLKQPINDSWLFTGKKGPKMDVVVHMLVLSEKYNLTKTLQTAFNMATKMLFSELRNTGEFNQITHKTLVLLMVNRIDALETAGRKFLYSVSGSVYKEAFREVLGL